MKFQENLVVAKKRFFTNYYIKKLNLNLKFINLFLCLKLKFIFENFFKLESLE